MMFIFFIILFMSCSPLKQCLGSGYIHHTKCMVDHIALVGNHHHDHNTDSIVIRPTAGTTMVITSCSPMASTPEVIITITLIVPSVCVVILIVISLVVITLIIRVLILALVYILIALASTI